MTSLANKTIIGVLWNLGERLAARGISVFVTLLLAHYLSPEDFGLIAMMTVFISVARSLMESGFRQALIRLPNANQQDFNTAFYANIILGIISYCVLFAVAPVVADFYHEQQLTSLIRTAGLVVIINSFQVVQYANLSRALNFRAQFQAAFPAAILSSAVAVFMAYRGYGVWALIAQMLVSATSVAVLLWLQNLWRPSLTWSGNSLKTMYQFGYKLLLTSLLDTGFRNMYVVVVAKLFSVNLAGLYFFADRIREVLILQLVGSIQKVTYPALSSVQSDVIRLKLGYRKVIATTGFIILPIVLFFAAMAEPIYHILLPEKWWPSILFIQLMCIASVFIPLNSVNINILKVLGRSDLLLGLEVIKKTIGVLILFFSFQYGVEGILIGQIISSMLVLILNSYFSKHLISYSLKEQLSDFIPALALSSFIAVSVWVVQEYIHWNEIIKLFVLVIVAMLVYLLFAKLFHIHGYELTYRIYKEKKMGYSDK